MLYEILNEDFGNLRELSPPLRKFLSNYARDSLDGSWFGRNMQVTSVRLGDTNALADEMFDVKSDLRAIVIVVNGEQRSIFVKSKRDDHFNTVEVLFFDAEKHDFMTCKSEDIFKDVLKSQTQMAQQKRHNIRILKIRDDHKRAHTSKIRKELQKGVIPTRSDKAEKYAQELKKQLATRLMKFKDSRAPEYGLEELIDKIIENGYIERFRIGKYAYKLHDVSINAPHLFRMRKDALFSESVVVYELTDTSETEWWSDFVELANKYRSQGIDDETVEKLVKEQMAPRVIRFILGMKGGYIVPVGYRAYPPDTFFTGS